MASTEPNSDGTHTIRLARRGPSGMGSTSPIAVLSEYLEKCDDRRIAPDTNLFLIADDRLTRDDIVSALPLCVNIIRIGTTLILPDGERFGRDDINASLSLRLVLALATLDEISREHGTV